LKTHGGLVDEVRGLATFGGAPFRVVIAPTTTNPPHQKSLTGKRVRLL
jgi:hypothetical protein